MKINKATYKSNRKRKKLTLSRVNIILNSLGKRTHYLKNKPVSKWDKYDKANWNSIIRNTVYKKWMK